MLRTHRRQVRAVLRVPMMLQELRRMVLRVTQHRGVDVMSRVVPQRSPRVSVIRIELRIQVMRGDRIA